MRYPPEDWAIKPEDHFTAHTVDDDNGRGSMLVVDVCVQVSRDAVIEGNFKILLGGGEPIRAEILAKEVLVMGGAGSFKLIIERFPRDIMFRLNTTTSDWFDVEESIAEGQIEVMLVGGGGDTENALRKRLRKESSKNQNGGALRWAVGAGPDGFLELQLQALPVPAAVANSKLLLRFFSLLKKELDVL